MIAAFVIFSSPFGQFLARRSHEVELDIRTAPLPEKRTGQPEAVSYPVRSQQQLSLSNPSITTDHCNPGSTITPIKKQSVQHRLPYPSPLSPSPPPKGPQRGHHIVRSLSSSTHARPELREDQENSLETRPQDSYFPYDGDDKAKGKGLASYLAPEYTLSTPPTTPSSPRTGYVTPLETPTKSTRPPRSSARLSAIHAESLNPTTPSTSSHNQSERGSRWLAIRDSQNVSNSAVNENDASANALLAQGIFRNGRQLEGYQLSDLRRLRAREAGEKVCDTSDSNNVGYILHYGDGFESATICIALIVCNPAPPNFEGTRATLIVVRNEDKIKAWKSEITKYAPELRICGHDSTETELDLADVVLVTYARLRIQYKINTTFFARSWFRQINDEAHLFKNPESQVFEAVCAIRKRHGLCLTSPSQPVKKSKLDLYSLLKFLKVTYKDLNDLTSFKGIFHARTKEGKSTAQAVLSCVKKSFYICRPTTERTDVTVKVLRGFLEGIIYQLIEGLPLATPERLSYLAQASDHPSLVQRLLEQNFEQEPFAAVLRNSFMSAKLNAMLRISQNCKARGQRMAIFTCFANLIPVMIQGFNDWQISWTTYSDEGDAEYRRRSLNKIAEDSRWSVVLISVAGAALDEWDPGDWKIGLDITSCNNIIFMEPWWHREAEEQVIGLVHSGAQTLPVTVYRLIADGTIDELVLEKRT